MSGYSSSPRPFGSTPPPNSSPPSGGAYGWGGSPMTAGQPSSPMDITRGTPPASNRYGSSWNEHRDTATGRHSRPIHISSSPVRIESSPIGGKFGSVIGGDETDTSNGRSRTPVRRGSHEDSSDGRDERELSSGSDLYLIGNHRAISELQQENNAPSRQINSPSRDRKRRLTASAQQGRLQRTRSGEINRPSATLPHRSVSMITPSSRGKANPAGLGSSRETAIDIASSSPEAGPSGAQGYRNREFCGDERLPPSLTAGSVSFGGAGPSRTGITDSPATHIYRSRLNENPLPSLPPGAKSSDRYQANESFPHTGIHPWEAAAPGPVPRPGRRHHSSSLQDTPLDQSSHYARRRGLSEAIRNPRRDPYAAATWQVSGSDERALRAFFSGAPQTQSLAEALRSPRGETDLDTTLPRWQPDAEVTSCPICGVGFGLWHRKHHCRKCGRVVCGTCSPHRITIPRQYIVRPPGSSLAADSSPAISRQIVDLTGEHPEPMSPTINPALGGGEEVRLCNPCVPDPNPNPPGYGVRSRGHRSTYSLPSNMGNVYAREHEARANNRSPYGYSVDSLQSTGSSVQQTRRDTDDRSNRRSHGDSQSSISSTRQSIPSTSARRPTVSEQDLCPICGRVFPEISSSQPLEAREEHIRHCIENYGAPAPAQPVTSTRRGPAPPPPPPAPPAAARMLEFTATEKDCIGEDGETAECTICMVDYEVADLLVRLECLCKFHKHCILDWFDHKMECPVHKVS